MNAHATQWQIYFHDPFLAYVYLASVPFFTALFHTFKVLGYARKNRVISPPAVKSLRTIKFCAIALIVFIAGGEVFVLLHDSDDRAGGVFMGMLFGFGSLVIGTAAATFESVLQHSVNMKSENDPSV